MNKRNLAVMASCMLLYTSFAYAANVEETQNSDGVATDKVNQSDTQLDEVVVTDTMLNPLKIPVKATVITEEEIKAKGAKDAADALRDVAGLYVVGNSSKGRKQLQIRGSDADNTKIFVDGVMLSPIGDGKVDLRSIPAENIEKIEVIKGAVPVLYGTDAPGGVVFITTKNGGKKGGSGAITFAQGGDDSHKFFGSFGGSGGKLDYYFSAKRELTDGYTLHTREDADFFNEKLHWTFNDKSSLTLFASQSKRTEQIPNRYNPVTGALTPNQGKGGTLSGGNSFFNGYNNFYYDPVEQTYVGIVYNQKLNDKNEFSLKFYRSGEESTLYAQAAGSPNGVWRSLYWDGKLKGYELQDTIKTSKINTFTWGYNFETRNLLEKTKTNILSSAYNRGTYDYKGSSWYVQNATNFTPKLSTSFGYRHSEIKDHTQTSWNPNVYGKETSDDPVFSFNYAFSGQTNLHGSIGKSQRFPNAKERSSPGGIYPYPTGPVCTYLLPEEVINREVGLSFATHSGFAFDATYFSKDITNMIKGQGQSGGRAQYYNIPHVDMNGYEVEVSKKITKRLTGFWNFSYTNAVDTLMRAQVSDIPYRKFSYGFNYTGKEGINANLAVRYTGATRSMFTNGNGNGDADGNSGLGGTISQHLPAYHVVDLKISKTTRDIEYYIRAENLFDEDYYSGAYLEAPGRYSKQ